MRYIADEHEEKSTRLLLQLAAREARKSDCRKSQRGAIVVDEVGNIIGRGYNLPMVPGLCCLRDKIRDNSRVERCTAIHAEQMAVLDALSRRESLAGLTLYHIKVKDGQMIPSGHPSCTVCSRITCFVGVKVVLWHREGYAVYGPEEFNDLSFQYFLEKSKKESVG